MAILTQDQFEDKCYEIILKIIKLDGSIKQSYAVSVAEEMIILAKKLKKSDEVIKIFDTAKEELLGLNDSEYSDFYNKNCV